MARNSLSLSILPTSHNSGVIPNIILTTHHGLSMPQPPPCATRRLYHSARQRGHCRWRAMWRFASAEARRQRSGGGGSVTTAATRQQSGKDSAAAATTTVSRAAAGNCGRGDGSAAEVAAAWWRWRQHGSGNGSTSDDCQLPPF